MGRSDDHRTIIPLSLEIAEMGWRLAVDSIWFRGPFRSDCQCGESNNLSEMGAEFGLVCCCFLLPLHPR
jgi:hypothetical protein